MEDAGNTPQSGYCFLTGYAKLSPMIREKSLVLYKTRPALATAAGEKIDISPLGGGEKIRVREKDIELLSAGP
ncbi:MAG: hypothetical protein LBG45_00415, partial [Dysgonamonadaceae bacterium]|nr:hypothetical protein [Dysgonamonadaceae bacterium]